MEHAMDMQKKLFAFRLAESQAKIANRSNGTWKARDGIAIAGCTAANISAPRFIGDPLTGVDSAAIC
jgi:hypothetical protein